MGFLDHDLIYLNSGSDHKTRIRFWYSVGASKVIREHDISMVDENILYQGVYLIS